MKPGRIHLLTLSSISAFVIGVILFAVFWKMLFGSASSLIVLAGMTGVSVAVVAFWIWNEIRHRNKKDE